MRTQTQFGLRQDLMPGKAYLTEREVAERLNMSVKWVQKMRATGGGIPFVKIGGSVRYAAAEILLFESQARRISTSDLGPIANVLTG